MCRRYGPLTFPVLLFACLTLLAMAPEVQAHALIVECRILTDGNVQVEGWYNSIRPHPAQQAEVQVIDPRGLVLREAKLDDKGIFTFPLPKVGSVKVVVYQAGHRAEVEVSPPGMTDSATPPNIGSSAAVTVPPTPFSSTDRTMQQWVQEVLTGIGFLLALAAFVLSVRNNRHIRILIERMKNQEGPVP